MSELDDALDRLRGHDGVEHVLVLGRDGLLIQHAGSGPLDPETVSAMVPGVVQSAAALGGAAGTGAATVVARLERGVAVVQELSGDVLLAVLVRAGAGFAPLLHELAESRAALAALV